MKILIVASRISRAGTSRMISMLSQEWEKLEHEIDIFLFKPYFGRIYKVSGKIVKNGTRFPGLISYQVFCLLMYLYKNKKYDRLIGFSEDANYPLIITSKLLGLTSKTILSVHNLATAFSHRTKKRVAKFYPNAHKVIAVSQGVKNQLIDLGLKNCQLIYNGIDINYILKESRTPCDITFDQSYFNICTLGRIHRVKGYDLLIESFYQFVSKNSKSLLHIIALGDQTQLLELVKLYKIENKVILYEGMKNPFSLIKKADIFVLSSRKEAFGLVLLEAMALKLPIISFSSCGPNEIIENNISGILVESGNVEQFAEKMDYLYKNEPIRKKLGLNGYKKVKDVFLIENICNNWLTL